MPHRVPDESSYARQHSDLGCAIQWSNSSPHKYLLACRLMMRIESVSCNPIRAPHEHSPDVAFLREGDLSYGLNYDRLNYPLTPDKP